MNLLARMIRELLDRSPDLVHGDVNTIARVVKQSRPDISLPLIEHMVREILIEIRRDAPNISKAERRRLTRIAAYHRPGD